MFRELHAGGIDLWAFWRRRIQRILPALLVVVFATFVVGHAVLYAPDRYMLAINAAGALLSVGNITHWRNYGGYWSGDANDSPFLHMWSLGVEEQFYIVYPLVLVVAWRLLQQRTWLLLVAGLVCGTALYIVASQRSPAAAFYLFPTRAWELLAGGVAAAANLRRTPGKTAATAMSVSGLALVLAAYVIASEQHQVVGALLAVTGATLVVGSGTSNAFAALRLTVRPLIVIGLISYSIYLWHWPLIVLGGAFEARNQVEISPALYFIASLALGWVSWRFVETPARRTRYRWAPVLLLTTAVVMAGGHLRTARLQQFRTRHGVPRCALGRSTLQRQSHPGMARTGAAPDAGNRGKSAPVRTRGWASPRYSREIRQSHFAGCTHAWR